MSSYTVSFTCKRADALAVGQEIAKVFGSVERSVIDPLREGEYEDERRVTLKIAAQQGDPEDPFEEAYYIDRPKLDQMISQVREAVPAIYYTHVIEH